MNCSKCNRIIGHSGEFTCECNLEKIKYQWLNNSIKFYFRYYIDDIFVVHIYDNTTKIFNKFTKTLIVFPKEHFNLTKEKINKLMMLK